MRIPAAEPLQYLEQSPHLIVGWPNCFPPWWAPCQYPCELESCEKCQGKQAWNCSFHLAWKTNLPSVQPILLVKEAQGEENTAVRQPLSAEQLYQAGGLCGVWAADKTQETHSYHTAGSTLCSLSNSSNKCTCLGVSFKVPESIKSIQHCLHTHPVDTGYLSASRHRAARWAAAEVTWQQSFSCTAQTISHVFLLGLGRFVQHEHVLFPQ